MARVSLFVIAPPVIFLGIAGLFYTGMQRDDPDALPSARIGQEPPALDLAQLGELEQFDVEALGGEGAKLVNFWASWCGPCRAEHPNLELLAEEGLPIYGINYKDDPEKALAFLDELGNPYAGVGADPNGRAALDWGLYGVPETFIVDADGKIVLRFAGPITGRVLEEKLRPAIEAAQ